MDKIVNIQPLDPNTLDYQTYSLEDQSLVSNSSVDISFDPSLDTVEYLIFDLNKNILSYNPFYPDFSLLDNKISIDPQSNLESEGYTEGQYITKYNFVSNLLGSSFVSKLYIEEISSDRTELRLNTTRISNDVLVFEANRLINEIEFSQGTYPDFYLNFGDDKLIIANNILLDDSNVNDPTILIKLYESLPPEFDLKSELWVTNKIANSTAYQIDIQLIFDLANDNIRLQGPNLSLKVDDQVNNSTEFLSFSSLFSNTSTLGTGSLKYQLDSLLAEKGIEINVDYVDYSNFIHFSSAKTRLENFVLKLALIEQYQSSGSLSSGTTNNTYISQSQNIWLNKINDIITNFDGYEYYLYYESGSYTWPKSNSVYPYINVSTTDPIATIWLDSQIIVAEDYDSENKDYLLNSIPSYLTEDPNNIKMQLFVEMLGQHFDNIWIYIKDITNKYNADNRLDYGISKDLVADILRDFGIKIYQNNFSTNDLFSALLGITSSGSLYNIPNASTLLPPPVGYEYIDTFVTASATGSLFPVDDLNKEIYKRIYHNLPYLLKKKGTLEGLRTLITLYGIPDTILRIVEFGGKDKTNVNDWDYWYNYFSYAFDTKQQSQPLIPWLPLLRNYYDSQQIILPDTIALRFKTNGIPDASLAAQSILVKKSNTGNTEFDFGVFLTYAGSGYSSGSYSGAIPSESKEYGNLNFILKRDSLSEYTASIDISLPFFDGGWWSVMLKRDTHAVFGADSQTITYSLYAKNKIYDGVDGYKIGFQGSSSITIDGFNFPSWNTSWNNFSFYGTSFVPFGVYVGGYISGITQNGTTLVPANTLFSGSFQEFRYYGNPINESTFDDFVMNPKSIEGNTTQGSGSSKDLVDFRAPLGNLLEETYYSNNPYETYTSLHPAITGSCITESFWSDGTDIITNASLWDFAEYTVPDIYLWGDNGGTIIPVPISHSQYDIIYYTPGLTHTIPQTEVYYIDTPIVGLSTPNSNKIKDANSSFYGEVLSSGLSLQQNYEASQSYTRDVNYLEVGFSPQNEINDDIAESLGYFDIGKYIGDPQYRFTTNNNYPDLNKLRNEYFCKYIRPYNLNDYVRLIKYFDNSLFKLIKDFVPARTSLASGLIIKSHFLERNRYQVPSVEWEKLDLTASIDTAFISGGIAGGFSEFGGENPFIRNFIPEFTQSWQENIVTPLGLYTQSRISQDEFYNGEFSGSIVQVYEEQVNPFLEIGTSVNSYTVTQYIGKKYKKSPIDNSKYYVWDEPVLETKFLNPYTEPDAGEIYIYSVAVDETAGTPTDPYIPVNYYTKYIKVSKLNSSGNDLNVALSLLSQLNISLKDSPTTVVNTIFPIYNIINNSSYYLFEIDSFLVTPPNGPLYTLPTPISPALDPNIIIYDNIILVSEIESSTTVTDLYAVGAGSTGYALISSIVPGAVSDTPNANIGGINSTITTNSTTSDLAFMQNDDKFLIKLTKTQNTKEVFITITGTGNITGSLTPPGSGGGGSGGGGFGFD